MALSGSYSGSWRGYTLRTEWEAVQNQEENYSDLNITLYLVCGSGYDLYVGQRTHTVSVDGTDYHITSSGISTNGNETKKLGSISKKIYHNSDGTCEVSLSSTADMRANVRGSYIGSFSGGSSSITLDRIPRMSTISDKMDGTRELGTEHTIHINKFLSGNITHTVWYLIRGDKGLSGWHYIARNTSDLDLNFIPTTEHIDLQPNNQTIYMDIGTDTYKDGVKFGDTTYSTGWYMQIPKSAKPIISSVNITETVEKVKALGVYVQNNSKINIVTDARGVEGSTIKNITVEVDKKTYSGNNITTTEILSNGNIDVEITVTDSRDRQATTIKTIKVEPYFLPKINKFDGYRTDADNKTVRLIVDFAMAGLNGKNVTTWQIEKKPKQSNTWVKVMNGTQNNLKFDDKFAYNVNSDYEYNFRLTIKDIFSKTEQIFSIFTSFALLDFHRDGKGFAVGKSATIPDGFEIDIPLYINKGVINIVHKAELKNSWRTASDPNSPLRYFKDINSVVHLQGVIAGGTTAWGTEFFTLKEGYRPKILTYGLVLLDDGSIGYVRIEPNGQVRKGKGNDEQWKKWTCFDGIAFLAE